MDKSTKKSSNLSSPMLPTTSRTLEERCSEEEEEDGISSLNGAPKPTPKSPSSTLRLQSLLLVGTNSIKFCDYIRHSYPGSIFGADYSFQSFDENVNSDWHTAKRR
ncbi:hypothetical protein BgiBS90_014473 [Biomphalaria glabrata]|nr:hypothetical protein BgiBS90_014473 [Biomphalaria glabrata]